MDNKKELTDYLLSDEYIGLLERSICARLCTTSEWNRPRHTKAISLIHKYKEEDLTVGG